MERLTDQDIDSIKRQLDLTPFPSLLAHALEELQRWRRVEAMLRRNNSSASNVGAHVLAAAALTIIDEPKE